MGEGTPTGEDDEKSKNRSQSPNRGVNKRLGCKFQVLVIGDSITALGTAGFLNHAGLNPVLAPGDDHTPNPDVVPLWRPGLELLERLGVRRPVETVGTPITALKSCNRGHVQNNQASTPPELVTVNKDELRTIFQEYLGDRLPAVEYPIQSIEKHQHDLRVSFTNGITETFDVVVTSNRELLEENPRSDDAHSMHWWEFDWPSQISAPATPTEVLTDGAAAMTLPVGSRVHTQIITERQYCPRFPLEIEELANVFSEEHAELRNAILHLNQPHLQYGRLNCDVPANYSEDNIVLVGPDVHGTIPGDCLGPTLALEDGWVLADTLAYGPSTVPDALEDYTDRRRRRLTRLNKRVEGLKANEGRCENLSWPIQQLCRYRSVTFSHVLSSHTDPFGDDIPDRL